MASKTGPFEITDLRLRQITDIADRKFLEACQVITDGLHNGVLMLCAVDGDQGLHSLMRRAMVENCVVRGELWIAIHGGYEEEGGTEDEKVVGVAAWLPPSAENHPRQNEAEQGYTRFFNEMQRTQPDLFDWWFETLSPQHDEIYSKYLKCKDDPTGKNFKLRHHRLVAFAVMPEMRRHGIGRRLLEIGEHRAAMGGVPVLLSADNSDIIKVYHHLGYILLGSEMIQGPRGVNATQYVMKK